jgi:hypothetical protein
VKKSLKEKKMPKKDALIAVLGTDLPIDVVLALQQGVRAGAS